MIKVIWGEVGKTQERIMTKDEFREYKDHWKQCQHLATVGEYIFIIENLLIKTVLLAVIKQISVR